MQQGEFFYQVLSNLIIIVNLEEAQTDPEQYMNLCWALILICKQPGLKIMLPFNVQVRDYKRQPFQGNFHLLALDIL